MNLLGFKDVVFNSLTEDSDFVHINASVINMNICPNCGSKKIWVHDHRIQRLRILTFTERNVLFI